MNMKKTFLSCFIMSVIFIGFTCSKAPIVYPDAQNRIVLGEFFTHDM